MIASIIVTAIGMCFFEGESVIRDIVRPEPVRVIAAVRDENVDLSDSDEERFATGQT